MNFTPVNNYLLVERIAEEKEKLASLVEMPESYQQKTSSCSVVKYLGDEESELKKGTLLIVDTTMIEEVKHDGQVFSFVKASFVKGYISL